MERKFPNTSLINDCNWQFISETDIVLTIKANTVGKEELAASETTKYFNHLAYKTFLKPMQFKVKISLDKEEVLHPDEHLKREVMRNEILQKAQNIFQGTIQQVNTNYSDKDN